MELLLEESARDLPSDNRFVTWTDWSGYLKFLEAVGDRRLRITFDRGTLELMSPSPEHELRKSVLSRLIDCLLMEREIDFQAGGATTLKSAAADRGLEPDECYWIEHWQSFGPDYDLDRDPPPDLAIEIEVSRSAVNRMSVYQRLGVPEIWRFRRSGTLEIWLLEPVGYRKCVGSPLFPDLPLQELAGFVIRAETLPTNRLVAEFRRWVQQRRA